MQESTKKAVQLLILTDLLQSGTIDQSTYNIAADTITGQDSNDPLDPAGKTAA